MCDLNFQEYLPGKKQSQQSSQLEKATGAVETLPAFPAIAGNISSSTPLEGPITPDGKKQTFEK